MILELSLLRSAAGIALLTVLLAPFAFGAVGTTVWVPLAWLWILLGVWSLARDRGSSPGAFSTLTPALLPAQIEVIPESELGPGARFAVAIEDDALEKVRTLLDSGLSPDTHIDYGENF